MPRASRSRLGLLGLWLLFTGLGLSVGLVGHPALGEEPATRPRLFTLRAAVATPATAPAPEAPAAEAPAAENATPEANPVSEQPTHRQTTVIQANVEGQPQTAITSFCLTPDDRILAGCAGESGELRVFDKEGKFVETWSIPVKPDAIYARADGTIFLAGEGQVAQLSKTGRILLQKEAPHAADLNANPQQLREQIVAQAKQRADMMARQTKQFDDMIARSDKEIAFALRRGLLYQDDAKRTRKLPARGARAGVKDRA